MLDWKGERRHGLKHNFSLAQRRTNKEKKQERNLQTAVVAVSKRDCFTDIFFLQFCAHFYIIHIFYSLMGRPCKNCHQ